MITVKDGMFHLQGKNISYIMEISKEGNLYHRYFGRKVHYLPAPYQPWTPVWGCYDAKTGISLEAAPQEYPSYGVTDLKTPAYVVKNPQGNTLCTPTYRSHTIYEGKRPLPGLPAVYDNAHTARTLEIVMEDSLAGVRLVHSYTVFEEFDIVCRSTRIENIGEGILLLQAAGSACLELPDNGYEAVYLVGRWSQERRPVKIPVQQGKVEISNARGGSGHQINPFVMLAKKGATETSGEVYGFSLVYSGDHATVVEESQYGTTRVIMGINPLAFEAEVRDSFQTPECILAYSPDGFGRLSRTYHDVFRSNLCRGKWKGKSRPIVVNNWEATVYNFDEQKLLSIVEKASQVGIEMFVLDDGWFGKRNDENCSLGDWVVNKQKLPSGIKGFADKVKGYGMAFGLWFEPEMISPDSDLYRAHPDWAIRAAGREPAQSRYQFVLDLTRPEVCDYVIESVSAVLREADISYVKWDMNRHISDMPYPGYNHAYILGLYRIMETLTERFPDVLFESCSGGGGRFDAGMLYYMPQVWTSDNTDAIDRCRIQYGTSFAYPPAVMAAHVSSLESNRHKAPLKTRADVAYGAVFGYELDLTKLQESELEEIREQIQFYKQIQPLVLQGDFYRLRSPFEGNLCAWEIAAKDGSEAFACAVVSMADLYTAKPVLRFAGLDADAVYQDTQTGRCYGGDLLMYMGLEVELPQEDSTSVIYHFVKQK